MRNRDRRQLVKTYGINMWQARLLNFFLLVFGVMVSCGAAEGFLRVFWGEELAITGDERALVYRYDARLGWFPRENFSATFSGAVRSIFVANNSRGFRDVEHRKTDKPGLIFLGDSFVWGYDVEVEERFTEKLRFRMPQWEVYNLGVSGYGTDQEILLLESQFDFYRPRIVFLVFCTHNDFHDNSSNMRYGYYKPHYAMTSSGISLQGVPVPKALTYFVREYPLLAKSYLVRLFTIAFSPGVIIEEDPNNDIILYPSARNPTFALLHRLNEFVARKGSTLVVGLEQPHRQLEAVLRSEGIPYLQLDGAERFFADGFHWSPDGHTAVSEAIYYFLQERGFLLQKKEHRN